MKVFISWSGDRSKEVAEVLGAWLPTVIQSVEPWVSTEIGKGSRWGEDIVTELNDAKAGIICLTPDNLEAPWIHFEAGALSKTLGQALVSPYLLGVEPADVGGPLGQFQATVANKPDTLRLLQTLNRESADHALPDARLEKAFEVWWPELEGKLKEIQSHGQATSAKRPDRELLEEILDAVRKMKRIGSALPLAGLGATLPFGTGALTGLMGGFDPKKWASLTPAERWRLRALNVRPLYDPFLAADLSAGSPAAAGDEPPPDEPPPKEPPATK